MKIFVITGPSGVGKSHLVHELTKQGIYPLEVYTDRVRRPTEGRDADRVFLSPSEFSQTSEEFLYWFEFQNNHYGYKRSDVQRLKNQGSSLCFNIPPIYLPGLLKKIPRAVTIFLTVETENFSMLFERMVRRDISPQDDPLVKIAKMNIIKDRIDFARNGVGDYHMVQQALSANPLSRTFVIRNDKTIYDEALPYISKIK